MKKISLLLIAGALVLTTACKNEKKQENQTTTKEETKVTENFTAKAEATAVYWTAYKTTAKTPVKGKFNIVKFNDKKGSSVIDALDGLEFSIPVSSIFSKDESRDSKLKEFFFAAMDNTEFITGTLHYNKEAKNFIANITMNGVSHKTPLSFNVEQERRVTLKGNINVKDWDALGALESLHKACFDLHKGPDGVSKTWEEVAIEVSTFLRE